uniref:E3 ubiquitin-protein ligase n=1 Tax=Timema shepardi TaxID=629360 RepID=A0A7R9AZH9_TIMSH|nr:unnamed protein product [Timema shepardi]
MVSRALTALKSGKIDKMLSKSLLSLLECPVCFEYMQTPIQQCLNGHSLCSNCRPKLDKCPSCRRSLSTTSRNVALEQIAEQCLNPSQGIGVELRPPKQHRVYDCLSGKNVFAFLDGLVFGLLLIAFCSAAVLQDVEVSSAALLIPMKPVVHVCLNNFAITVLPVHFQPSVFQDLGCQWQGKRSELWRHVKETHGPLAMHLERSKLCFRLTKHNFTINAKTVILFYAMNELFWYHFHQDCKRNMWYQSVQYIGPISHASRFRYELEFSSEESRRRITFSRETHSDMEKMAAVFDSGDCFSIDLNSVKFFVSPNNCLNFKLANALVVLSSTAEDGTPPPQGLELGPHRASPDKHWVRMRLYNIAS